jgi:hypothetical protein
MKNRRGHSASVAGILLVLLLGVASCGAPPLDPTKVSVAVAPSPLHDKLTGIEVVSALEDEPMGIISRMPAKEYVSQFSLLSEWQKLLEASLEKAKAFDGTGDRMVRIHVSIHSLSVPMAGFSMTSSVTAQYEVLDAGSGNALLSHFITTHGEAGFGDATWGSARAREAAYKAVYLNVGEFIRILNSKGSI